MEELWSNAQTTGQIIARSGTQMNSAINKEGALRDAQTRLQTGGGLFGSEGLTMGGILNQDNRQQSEGIASIGMTLNIYLWQGALDTISFMPLNSADPIGGTIITDWYSSNQNSRESIKISIRFLTNEIRTDALDIKVFSKICNDAINCKITETDGVISKELKRKILKTATLYKEEKKNKKK